MKDNQVKCQPQLKEPWGKLVSMSSELNNILLIKNKYTFGKASDNDVNLCNDSIEGRHFELSQGEDGTNYICDLSSSGTFLEEKRLRKGVPEKIETGQRIQLGMKSKRKMENPIAFVFCELNQS
jgi:pSer/pThr/pTyr-binding forkhead associated (FHA) protein